MFSQLGGMIKSLSLLYDLIFACKDIDASGTKEVILGEVDVSRLNRCKRDCISILYLIYIACKLYELLGLIVYTIHCIHCNCSNVCLNRYFVYINLKVNVLLPKKFK